MRPGISQTQMFSTVHSLDFIRRAFNDSKHTFLNSLSKNNMQPITHLTEVSTPKDYTRQHAQLENRPLKKKGPTKYGEAKARSSAPKWYKAEVIASESAHVTWQIAINPKVRVTNFSNFVHGKLAMTTPISQATLITIIFLIYLICYYNKIIAFRTTAKAKTPPTSTIEPMKQGKRCNTPDTPDNKLTGSQGEWKTSCQARNEVRTSVFAYLLIQNE